MVYFANMVRKTTSPKTHSPRIQRKRAERQELIVDTAMNLLIEGGLANVTVGRLAKELDYTPGALYRYFPSMEVLLAHMQRRAIDALQLRVGKAVVALGPDAAPLARIRAAAGAYLQSSVDATHEMSLVSQMLAVPQPLLGEETSMQTAPRIIAVLQFVEALITSAQDSGALEPGPAQVRTVQLWAALQGAVQLGKLTRFDPVFSARNIGESLVEDLLTGWGASPSG